MPAFLLAAALLAYDGTALNKEAPVGAPAVQLLNDPALQSLLELSDEQKANLAEDLQRYLRLRVEYASETRAGRKPSDEALEKLNSESARIAIESTKNLTGDQRIRLTELSWQLLGPDAFAIPEYREALGLTQEDLERIEPSIKRFVKEFRDLHRAFGKRELTFEQFKKDAAKLEAAATETAASSLTEASQATYRERCGKPAGITKWELKTEWHVEQEAVAKKTTPDPDSSPKGSDSEVVD